MHLRLLVEGLYKAEIKKHPQVVMKDLGITYQHSTPQSVADQWWFWNCENLPDPLPPYLSVAGLSDEDYKYWCG